MRLRLFITTLSVLLGTACGSTSHTLRDTENKYPPL